jgi:hypothetical protein
VKNKNKNKNKYYNLYKNLPSQQRRQKLNTIKELMSYPKCRSVTVINIPARPGSNHRKVNYINYNNNKNNNNNNNNDDDLKRTLRYKIIKKVFGSVVVVAFQSAFHSEKCANNIFFIF